MAKVSNTKKNSRIKYAGPRKKRQPNACPRCGRRQAYQHWGEFKGKMTFLCGLNISS